MKLNVRIWECELDLSRLCGIDLDETVTRRGHNYISILVDMDRESLPVIFASPGKGKECLRTFTAYLKRRKGNSANVIEVVSDMSPAFLAAAEVTFSNAIVTVDWSYVV